LIERLVVRVMVTDGEVEIRYAIPTSPAGEATRFCHLRSDYRKPVLSLEELAANCNALRPDGPQLPRGSRPHRRHHPHSIMQMICSSVNRDPFSHLPPRWPAFNLNWMSSQCLRHTNGVFNLTRMLAKEKTMRSMGLEDFLCG
jgi:hypothetical protein